MVKSTRLPAVKPDKKVYDDLYVSNIGVVGLNLMAAY